MFDSIDIESEKKIMEAYNNFLKFFESSSKLTISECKTLSILIFGPVVGDLICNSFIK